MSALAAPYLAGALLLVIAGGAKLAAPSAAAAALGGAGIANSKFLVRVWATVEVLAGGWAVSRPGPMGPAAATAVYLVLAAFALRAIRRGHQVRSCGCFGPDDGPPWAGHVAIDLGFAAAAAAVMQFGWAGPAAVTHEPLFGVPLVLLSGAIALLAYLILTALPAALSAIAATEEPA